MHITTLFTLCLTVGTCRGFVAPQLKSTAESVLFMRTVSNSMETGNNNEASDTSLVQPHASRRSFVQAAIAGAGMLTSFPAFAAADSVDSLLADLEASQEKLSTVPDLLQSEKWDEVRSILKVPPINYLWNMGDGQNTLLKLARAVDNPELIDLKDELSLSIQMCDQLTYDNVFVYFQPGNGKVKIKEPVELAVKANKQLTEAIQLAKESL